MSREMKDSGVEWIGLIPESWTVNRIKEKYSIINGSTPKSDISEFWDGEIVWVTPIDMYDNALLIDSRKKITESGYSSCGTTLVPKGSIVISTRAPIGQISIAGIELCTNQGCKSLVGTKETNERYLFYLLSISTEILNFFGRGTTFLELSTKDLANFVYSAPTLHAQSRIVDFLDKQCATIDRLISLQEEMIAELQAYKQSVITEAVTKGLDPDVPMKDSGVEWIGKTPIKWSEMRLKNLFISRCGGAWGIEKQDNDGDIVCIRVADFDFSTQTISEGERTIRNYTHDQIKRLRLSHGDILIEKSGGGEKTPVGRTIIFSGDVECVYSNFIERLRPIETTNCRYIAYLLKSLYQSSYMCIYINQTTGIQNLDLGSLLNEHIFLPDLQENNAIVYFLDARCNKIDKLITLKQSKIEMLKEYKKSLIYECVTGKREVV